MANVKAAMEYAASLDREAREKRLSESDLKSPTLIDVVAKHEQEIQELKRLVTPMMEFKRAQPKQEPKTYWPNDVYPDCLVRKSDYEDIRNSLSVLVNFIEGCHWEYELPSDVSNIIQDWPKIHRLGKTKRKEKNT